MSAASFSTRCSGLKQLSPLVAFEPDKKPKRFTTDSSSELSAFLSDRPRERPPRSDGRSQKRILSVDLTEKFEFAQD